MRNKAARAATIHRGLSEKAWDTINKTIRREIDAAKDFGADSFVDVIDYGSLITLDEVKEYISVLRENRDAGSGLVRKS